jgi:hypothetical protein
MSKKLRLSIMQPYIFPYIGYFHLINSSDKIVFCDDVTYIKQGWINRNRIISNNAPLFFSVPIQEKSSLKLIKNTLVKNDTFPIWRIKFLKTIKYSYSKAPNFEPSYKLIDSVLNSDFDSISDLAINSITSIYDYLGLEINYLKSSLISPNCEGIDKIDRVANITKGLGYNKFINPIGGKDLYSKKVFKQRDVDLYFVKSMPLTYKQFNSKHIEWLSIIDIIMFLNKEEIINKFSAYNII